MNNFIAALHGDQHERIPVWFMRQAGRYMSEYQEIRKNYNIRQMCMAPAITEKITYLPVNALKVDAAIIFADIILPLEAMGYSIDFNANGPMIQNGYRNNRDMHGIHEFDSNALQYRTMDAIRLFKQKHPETPIIGFSGGIITVLSYLLAGTSDNNLIYTKKIMINDSAFTGIKNMIKNMIITYLKMQISAGVDAVQIFDSWLGSLSPYMFEKYLKKDIMEIVGEIKGKIPLIYFSTGNSGMIEQFNDIKPDVISLDWRTSISHAGKILRPEIGIQGNLDPYVAQYSKESAIEETKSILKQTAGINNYVFNLGHGVLPETSPSTLKEIVETVHEHNFH